MEEGPRRPLGEARAVGVAAPHQTAQSIAHAPPAPIGLYGSRLKHGTVYLPLPEDEDVLAIGLNRAVALVDANGA